MEQRTFTVKTRDGALFEIENAVSSDCIKKTREKANRLKKRSKLCAAAAVAAAGAYIILVQQYLKTKLYVAETYQKDGNIHIGTLMSGTQIALFIVCLLIGILGIAALYAGYCINRKQWEQELRKLKEQELRHNVVYLLKEAEDKSPAIEFNRTIFGEVSIHIVIGDSTYILCDGIHRMPLKSASHPRLRFMTDAIYYFNAPRIKEVGGKEVDFE